MRRSLGNRSARGSFSHSDSNCGPANRRARMPAWVRSPRFVVTVIVVLVVLLVQVYTEEREVEELQVLEDVIEPPSLTEKNTFTEEWPADYAEQVDEHGKVDDKGNKDKEPGVDITPHVDAKVNSPIDDEGNKDTESGVDMTPDGDSTTNSPIVQDSQMSSSDKGKVDTAETNKVTDEDKKKHVATEKLKTYRGSKVAPLWNGTLVFLLLTLLCVGLSHVSFILGKLSKRDSELATTFIMMSFFCMWMMWAMTWLSQLHPVLLPIMEH